jgi:hypothetical protein
MFDCNVYSSWSYVKIKQQYEPNGFQRYRTQAKKCLNFVFKVGEAISWQSKHQQTIAWFSTKVEYIARTSRTRVAIWIKQIMKDIGFHQLGPFLLHYDNQ